ncbi:MAG TPA: winged helix-turn-helix domain-containing protein, partial [Nakamurella sp.]
MSETTRISAATLVRRLGPVRDERGQPAYRLLAGRIRSAVLDGRLAVATGLPSERELAAGLSLSRTTVGAAYSLLREQGWLDSRRGSGSRLRLPAGDLRSAGTDGRPGASASFGAGGIFGWPDGVGWQHDTAAAAFDTAAGAFDTTAERAEVIDLTTACLPAPADP